MNTGKKDEKMSNSQLASTGTTGKSGGFAAFCGRVTLVHFLTYSLVGDKSLGKRAFS